MDRRLITWAQALPGAPFWRWLGPMVFTTALVHFAAAAGLFFLKRGPCVGHVFYDPREWFANWDGQWYAYIVNNGYNYVSHVNSPVVFFPLYPIFGALVRALTGLRAEVSLLVASLLFLAAFCWAWQRYCQLRFNHNEAFTRYALWAVLLWPISHFTRMDYTESLFILLAALWLHGFAARWPVHIIALIGGAITATRLPGMLCIAVTGLHAWQRYRDDALNDRLLKTLCAMALSGWGLAAYALYLGITLGEPLGFLTDRNGWAPGMFEMTAEQWLGLLIFKPVWLFFSNGQWLEARHWPWLLSHQGTWVSMTLLTAWGIRKRWLTLEEIAFCALTLGLAYVVHANSSMVSAGRYAMVALPAYLVLGRLLAEAKPGVTLAFFTLCSALLFLSAALFAQWYCVY